MASNYTEASIKTLSSLEHIRLRPGMYIGRLGNGAHAEDGIYVLLKETIDNSIDEFMMGQSRVTKIDERNGTLVEFTPDEALFGKDFKFRAEFIEDMLWKYVFLNRGLTLTLNGQRFKSEHGLKDLLTKELSGEPLYPIIHL